MALLPAGEKGRRDDTRLLSFSPPLDESRLYLAKKKLFMAHHKGQLAISQASRRQLALEMSLPMRERSRAARSRSRLKVFTLAVVLLTSLRSQHCQSLPTSTGNVITNGRGAASMGRAQASHSTQRAININVLSNINLGDIIRAYRGSKDAPSSPNKERGSRQQWIQRNRWWAAARPSAPGEWAQSPWLNRRHESDGWLH